VASLGEGAARTVPEIMVFPLLLFKLVVLTLYNRGSLVCAHAIQFLIQPKSRMSL